MAMIQYGGAGGVEFKVPRMPRCLFVAVAQLRPPAQLPENRRPKLRLGSYRLNLINIKNETDMCIENSNPPYSDCGRSKGDYIFSMRE